MRAPGLYPCPFCNGAANFATVQYTADTQRMSGWTQNIFHFVTCEKCGASNCGLVGHATPELAAKHWNTRAFDTERENRAYREGYDVGHSQKGDDAGRPFCRGGA